MAEVRTFSRGLLLGAALTAGAAGCDNPSPCYYQPDDPGCPGHGYYDFAPPGEGGMVTDDGGTDLGDDLAGADLAGADLTMPPRDLTVVDQAMPPKDMAMVLDDLTMVPDLTQLPDLTLPPDAGTD
jgi:hypothetical protein